MWQLVGICNMIIMGGSKRGNIHSDIFPESLLGDFLSGRSIFLWLSILFTFPPLQSS